MNRYEIYSQDKLVATFYGNQHAVDGMLLFIYTGKNVTTIINLNNITQICITKP